MLVFIVVSPVAREPLTKSANEPNLGAADRGGSLHLMVSELGFKIYVGHCVLCAYVIYEVVGI